MTLCYIAATVRSIQTFRARQEKKKDRWLLDLRRLLDEELERWCGTCLVEMKRVMAIDVHLEVAELIHGSREVEGETGEMQMGRAGAVSAV